MEAIFLTCDSAVTLKGIVNANSISTIVTFQFGKESDYGMEAISVQSPVAGNIITNVSADISGLTPGMTYHYRVKAENNFWTIYGSEKTISTGLPILSTSSISDLTANAAKSGGYIFNEGCTPITDRGVY